MVTNQIHEFKLPDLGEGMHEAEIVEWLIKPGDTLKLDQTMVKVETDKALVEIPSPIAGRVSEIRVQSGQTAKVGDVLVVFETPSHGDTQTFGKSAGTPPPATSATAQPTTAPSQPAPTRPRVLAAPAVRKLAFELGIDLEQVTPSQPNGRVTIDDVRAYAERAKTASTHPASSAPPAVGTPPPVGATVGEERGGAGGLVPAHPSPVGARVERGEVGGLVPARGGREAQPIPDNREPLKGLRKSIAEHMERAWRIIPHATAFDEVDGTALIALRHSLKSEAEKRGVHLTYIPILIKLLIPVLKQFPIFNASLDEERREIVYKRTYHIGVATASPEGLLVPVLRNADQLTLIDITRELERLIEGARKRTLSLPELTGSTFTLNNVGSFGGSSGTPIINYPEVAILAIGRLQDKAIVEQGQIVVRPIMPLTLSFDHRLIDGAMSAAFLARFKELVENPQQLLLDMI